MKTRNQTDQQSYIDIYKSVSSVASLFFRFNIDVSKLITVNYMHKIAYDKLRSLHRGKFNGV